MSTTTFNLTLQNPADIDSAINRAHNGSTRTYSDANKPDPGTFGVGPIWIDGVLNWSDGVTFTEQSNSSNTPGRVVRNLAPASARFPTATELGTGFFVSQNVESSEGVRHSRVTFNSGATGQCYADSVLSLNLGPDTWYILSMDIITSTIPSATIITDGSGSSVGLARGSFEIPLNPTDPAGRYFTAFKTDSTGGAYVGRFGVGLPGNLNGYSVTLENVMLESLDAKEVLLPSEYVLPGYTDILNYPHNMTKDLSTPNRAIQSTNFSRYTLPPYSNILMLGDSRTTDLSEAGELLSQSLEPLGTNIYIHGRDGWTTTNAVGPTTWLNTSATIQKALDKDLHIRVISGGDAEVSRSLHPDVPIDTVLILTFGVNDLNGADPVGEVPVAMNNIQTIVQEAQNRGIQNFIMSDNSPFKDYPFWNANRQQAVEMFNEQLQNYCLSNGFTFFQIYDLMGSDLDPDILSDGAGTKPDYSADGIHYTSTGSVALHDRTLSVIKQLKNIT